MKNKLILILVISFVSSLCIGASPLPNESLRYVVTYKWGLIHKDAADATLSLSNHGDKVNLSLVARTKKWADKFYEVRDTLTCTVRSQGFKPLQYTKISHEGGKYGKDNIIYKYNGSTVTGECTRYRDKKGKISQSEKTLSATGKVYDMLSVFYYLRQIDFSKLDKGEVIRLTVFSGSKSELLTIKSLGKTTVETRNKRKVEAWHIKFNFTTEGKKKSSDDIDTWISTDSKHIPLVLVGKLAIGQIKVYYIG